MALLKLQPIFWRIEHSWLWIWSIKMALKCPGQLVMLQTLSFLSRILLNPKWLKTRSELRPQLKSVDHLEDSKGSEEHTFANMCSIWKHCIYIYIFTCYYDICVAKNWNVSLCFIHSCRYAYIIDVEIFDCDSRVSPWEGSRAGHVCCFIHIPTAIPGNYLCWKMWHLNFTSSKYNASKYNQKWWKVHLSGSCMTYRNIEIYT